MTDTLTPNLPELKRLNMWVQEQDKLEPGASVWFQGSWITLREETPMCQTAYCVAGMALVRAGHDFRIGEHGISALDGVDLVSSSRIEMLACQILNIDIQVGDRLFYGDNTASDVDEVIREIFTKAGADYDSVEPAPDLEIEIKAAEAVRPQLLPTLTNA